MCPLKITFGTRGKEHFWLFSKLTEKEVGQRGQVWGPGRRGSTCKYLCLKYFDFKKIGTKVKMVTPRDEADDKGDEDG